MTSRFSWYFLPTIITLLSNKGLSTETLIIKCYNSGDSAREPQTPRQNSAANPLSSSSSVSLDNSSDSWGRSSSSDNHSTQVETETSNPTSDTKESFRMEELWETLANLEEVDNKLALNKTPEDDSSKEDDEKHYKQGRESIWLCQGPSYLSMYWALVNFAS